MVIIDTRHFFCFHLSHSHINVGHHLVDFNHPHISFILPFLFLLSTFRMDHQLPHSSSMPSTTAGIPPMCHVFGDNHHQDIIPSSALFIPDFGKAPNSLMHASLHEQNNNNSAYTTSPMSSCPRDDISTPACGSPVSQFEDNSEESQQQAYVSWTGGNDNNAILSRHSSFSHVMQSLIPLYDELLLSYDAILFF